MELLASSLLLANERVTTPFLRFCNFGLYHRNLPKMPLQSHAYLSIQTEDLVASSTDHHGLFQFQSLFPPIRLPLRQHIPSRMPVHTTPFSTVTNAKIVVVITATSTVPGRILLAHPTFGIREVFRTIFSVWHPCHAVLGRG